MLYPAICTPITLVTNSRYRS